jgi:hypothetical protein
MHLTDVCERCMKFSVISLICGRVMKQYTRESKGINDDLIYDVDQVCIKGASYLETGKAGPRTPGQRPQEKTG